MALGPILKPRAVAVVGASRTAGTIGYEVFRNLLKSGFTGAVYPVNPRSPVVQSVKAWPTVAAIPDPVDLAVLVVPAARVLDAVEDCAKKGVKGVIVISAGFSETGAAGAALQQQLLTAVRGHGMRLIGPNCLGVVNADPSVGLNATFAPTFPPFGNVAFSSQSGALGLAILDEAHSLGLGISQFVSLGNKADVSGNDLLEFWEDDPATQVILLYMESLGNPEAFMETARRVSRKKPIAVVKAGRTEAGARAAQSHTGALAGMDVAVDALLGQAGVIRTDTIHELFDVARLLANQPPPAGSRVAIVTNAGGPGILASDACEARGLQVAPLCDASQEALRAFLPPEASVRNPVDMIASASAESYARALKVVLADPAIDAALVLFVTPIVTDPRQVADAIIRATAGQPKPVLACLMGRQGVPEAVEALRHAKIPVFPFPESAASALARAARYGAWLQAPEGKKVTPPLDLAAAQRVVSGVSGPRWLRPDEVGALLQAAHIPTARAVQAASAAEAERLSAALKFPVVVKVVSDTLIHKSDLGGVVLGVDSPRAVAAAFDTIAARLHAVGKRAALQGVLVQEQAGAGVETFIGATRDAEYGTLVGFGLGGTAVEVWKDVVFRVAPLRDTDAAGMLGQIRGRALLEGFRGAPPVDRAALIDLLLKVGHLVATLPEIAELDLNPVIARPDGAAVVDARVRIRPAR